MIGLQSTGEARTLEALEEGGGELNDFVSTAKYVQAADDFSHTYVILFVVVCHCNRLCCVAGVCCSPWLRSTFQLLTDRSCTACWVLTSQPRKRLLHVKRQHSKNRRERKEKVIRPFKIMASLFKLSLSFQFMILHSLIMFQAQRSKSSSRRRSLASTAACQVPAPTRANQRSPTESLVKTATTASSLSAQRTKTTISTHSKTILMTTRKTVRLLRKVVGS